MEWWFTADQHFDHTNIMKYCNRPWDDIGVDNNSYFPISLTELRAIMPISNSLGEGCSCLDRPKKHISFIEIQEAER